MDNEKIVDERNKTPNSKPLTKMATFFQRIKKIKNIEVIFCIVLIAIMLLLYSARINKNNNEDDSQVSVNQVISSYTETEQKLAKILSSIEGAGKVNVLITYDGTSQLVTADSVTKNISTRTDDSGGFNLVSSISDETLTPVLVMVDGTPTPLILKEINPQIEGVIIVAEGANSIKVRLEILKAASTALNIDKNKIEIFTMNN